MNTSAKTSKIISIFTLSSFIGLSACTPRDVKVVDDNTRLKISSTKKGGGSQPVAGEFSLGNYALSAFLAEKQIEAVELLKLTSGSLAASKSIYTVTPQADRGDGSKSTVLSSTKDILEYATDVGAWKAKTNKVLTASWVEKEHGLVSLQIKGVKLNSSTDSSDKDKTYVNLFEDSYDLAVSSADESSPNILVTVNIEGAIGGAKGGKNSPNKISVKLKMTVDKSSLATSQVKIVKAEAGMTYPGPNGKTFNSAFDADNLLVNVDGFCHSLDGSVNASAGPKNKYVVKFDDEKISVVGKNWNNKLASCGKRPTVDLSRLQVF